YYRLLPAPLREGVLDPLLRRIPVLSGSAFKDRARLLRKWGRVASLAPQEQFIQSGVYLDAADLARLVPGGLPGDPAAAHREAFARAAGADWVNQMLYVDSKVFLPSLNLNYNDKMGMAASVEIRVPFLDREFAQWAAWNVPPSLKIRGGETKHILRRALADDLPAEVLRQNKASFGAPVGYWLEHELKEMTDDLLSESSLKARGWLEPGAVRRMIAEHRERRRDWGMQLWQFLTLELWARQFRAD
ncbi:MAG TPA: asparagine synthase C-terminal domain-containing protein, partial [Elusimicrobiota bacterium]|nr:asparagine synthase C-terminal domain-containing protein [Elusimicrobiota bacterium]